MTDQTTRPPRTALEGRDARRWLRALGRREVPSELIGAEVLTALRNLHQVAYVRFASVYKGFTSPKDFVRELAELESRPPEQPSVAKER
ncbi:MAG: hypothetical protein ACRDYX_03335 [Egibacteraceae bacterium]